MTCHVSKIVIVGGSNMFKLFTFQRKGRGFFTRRYVEEIAILCLDPNSQGFFFPNPDEALDYFKVFNILWMEEILHQLVTIGNYKTL